MPGLWRSASLADPSPGRFDVLYRNPERNAARWNRRVDTLSRSILANASGTRNEPEVVRGIASGGARAIPRPATPSSAASPARRVVATALRHVGTAAALAADLRGDVGDDVRRP